MSRPNSPWSMVGLFMGNPKLRSSSRKRKDKGKADTGKDETLVAEIRGAQAPVAEAVKVEEPLVAPGATSEEGHTSDIEGSLADDQTYKVVARPGTPTPDEQDQGWTNVDAQQHQPSPASSTESVDPPKASPIVDEDMVDVLTQSVSAEFLQQQADALPGTPSYAVLELQRNEAEIGVLQTDKRELQARMRVLENELASQWLRNRELDDENRLQAQKLEQADAAMRAFEEEIVVVKNAEQQARRELEDGQRRIQVFEEEGHRQAEMIRRAANDLEDVQRELGDMQVQLKESAEQNKHVEEENRRLLEEKLSEEVELTIARSLHVLASNALDSALAESGKAREELEGTERRLEEGAKRNKDLEEKHGRLVEEHHAEKKELERLRHNHEQTTNALNVALAELEAVSLEKNELSEQVARQGDEMVGKEKEISDLRLSLAGAAKQLNQRQLHVLERQNRMLVDQLRRQSDDLRRKTLAGHHLGSLASDLSSKGDASKGIVGMIYRLNSEVFQAAAHMADTLDFSTPIDSDAQEIKGVAERASVTMGEPLVLAVRAISIKAEAEFNPLLVQVGLQACLISCCAKIIMSWFPGHWDYGDFLAAIYLRIVGSTSPTIATKWRALTERQLKKPSDITVQLEMEDVLLKAIVDALVIAGWRKTQPNARDFVAKFREKLSQIAKLALRLNVALDDDCEVMIVQPNEPFDGEDMNDAYEGDEKDNSGDYVVCTTDLGLKVAGSVTLRPKVVLRATLTEETGYHLF
ncbi:hypothetical protein D9615_008996 [Tricholomella constricta]|uniref:Uncharacterized protein n=1 Tax=Tricholomella constricta TaxID=117010 RepID=A0A8H5H0Z3_9AGAR|nr:hypothetical protein D9615_008996 [Tricholomella constricta]